MSPSSKPRRTLSNLMAGLESELDVTALVIGRVPAIIAAIPPPRGHETLRAGGPDILAIEALEKFVGEEQRHFGEKRVGYDDHDGREHRGLRGGAADSLRAAAHSQSFVTADCCQYEREKKWLCKTLHDVRKIQGIDRSAPELDGAESQGKNRSNAAAQQSHEIRHCRQKRQRQKRG